MLLGVLVVGRRHPAQPGVQIRLSDLSQHGVDETRAPVTEHHPGQFHTRRDRRVGRDPGAEQLMGTEGEDVEHRRIDLAQRPVDTRRDDRVVGALPAQCPVDQLGGEGRVAGLETGVLPGLPEQRRQHEIRIGVPLVDRSERLEGEDPYGILLGPAVGRGGTATGVLVQRCSAVRGLNRFSLRPPRPAAHLGRSAPRGPSRGPPSVSCPAAGPRAVRRRAIRCPRTRGSY